MRKRWGADNVLKTTYWEGAWPRQIWVVKFVVDFAVEFWACKQRVSGGEKISARFSLSMTMVQWDPRKSPWNSPFQNLFLTEIEFHGNFVCMRFSLQISPATFFATNFAGKMFRRHQFFAGAVFCRTHPSCWAQKHQLGVSASFSKRQAKQPQATSMHPLVTGESSDFSSFIMTITIIIACQPPIPTSEFCSLNVSPVFRSAGWLP